MDDGSPTYLVPSPPLERQLDRRARPGGGKTINASAAGTTPIIFDGTGAETFLGDNGPDVFNLQQ